MSDDPMVSCINLRKAYGKTEVLKSVSIELHRGEVLGLIGASGSGKTTLLRCMNFLEQPSSGDVRIDGELLGYKDDGGRRTLRRDKDLDRQRAEIGMVFQAYNLWPHMTVTQNIIEAPIRVRGRPKAEAIVRAKELLERVGLDEHLASVYPNTLSGGQQQRVAIARALAMDPKVLLLDEVTSALDPELVGEVQDTVRSLADDGITMAIVSHEMGFLKEVANEVAFLEKGVVAEVGPAKQLFTKPNDARTAAFLARVLD